MKTRFVLTSFPSSRSSVTIGLSFFTKHISNHITKYN